MFCYLLTSNKNKNLTLIQQYLQDKILKFCVILYIAMVVLNILSNPFTYKTNIAILPFKCVYTTISAGYNNSVFYII